MKLWSQKYQLTPNKICRKLVFSIRKIKKKIKGKGNWRDDDILLLTIQAWKEIERAVDSGRKTEE